MKRSRPAVLATLPPRGRGGLPQIMIDMRQPPQIKYAPEMGVSNPLTAYGEITVATSFADHPELNKAEW